MKTNLKLIMVVILLMVIILADFLCAANVVNEDKPAKGEYVFPLEPVWQADGAGEWWGDTMIGWEIFVPRICQGGRGTHHRCRSHYPK